MIITPAQSELYLDLIDRVTSDGYAFLPVAPHALYEITFHDLGMRLENDDALNVAVVLANTAKSATFNSLWNKIGPREIGVNITYLTSSKKVNDSYIIINPKQVASQYKVLGTEENANFTLQHIVNHELAHALTGMRDSSEFLALVNAINAETSAGLPRSLKYEDTIPGDYRLDESGNGFVQCFLAGTEITMWDGSKKPIEVITPDDWVLSHDKHGNPKPGRVVRTFSNEAKIILDFHGSFVTPGHVYFCAGGKYEGCFAPLIDILRDDGVVQHEDGTLIRAATGFAVGSKDDKEFWAFTVYEDKDGSERIRDSKKLRLGTKWMLPNGHHFTMREYMSGVGIELLDDGYVQFRQTGLKVPFIWTFSVNLPKPEDFVLARSQTTLENIYRADQWESMPSTMPVPLMSDSGPVTPMSDRQLDAAPRNMPMAFEHQTASSALTSNEPSMNRKQRMAHEAKQRLEGKTRRRAMH